MPRITSLLFDRDGTLIEDMHYLSNPSEVRILPGVAESLGRLARRGMRFFLVSNQSGIGRGLFPQSAAEACNRRVAELLAPSGVVLTDMIFCPHVPEDKCACRKPAPGMWRTLRDRHNLVPGACIMAGDKEEDILFAANAGLAGRVLVLTGKGQNTAARLGISLSGKYPQWDACPAEPVLPHAIIPDFSLLEKAVDLCSAKQDGLCDA